MKLVKVLDQEGNKIVSDPFNQIILKELVEKEQSVSELSEKLNMPTLKLWRRIQKLLKADLVELVSTEKIGNLEKKRYRSTATWFAPQQYFNYQPKNPELKTAFEIYSDIQKRVMFEVSTYGEVPKSADPIDYAMYANMQAFAQVCGKPEVQTKIRELQGQLEKFKEQDKQK
jgi:DNA-binding Lrp family transcriptional regulator